MKPLALLLLLCAAPSFAASANEEVALVVNGVTIRKSEVQERTWRQYGTAVLNEMADEILVRQAAEALKVKADPEEVKDRLKLIQSQFKDEEALKAQLEAGGGSLPELRARVEDQATRAALVRKAQGLEVTDKEAKEFFAANKEKLAAPDAVRLRRIVAADEKAAKGYLAALKAGADFAKLAAEVSLDETTKNKGGDLGYVARPMLPADAALLVFALNPGELGGPLKGPSGWSVFKVESFRAGKPAVYAEVEKDLKRTLLADKTNKAWPDYLQSLREKAKFSK